MHQTTSGEILKKTRVLNKDQFKDFLDDQKINFAQFENDCLYEDNHFLKSQSLNYFNFVEDDPGYKLLKTMIKQEYYNLESIYPFLGDVFLLDLFEKSKIRKKYKCFKFKKSYKNNFLKSLNHLVNKKIADVFFENFSLEYFVNVEFRKNLDKVFLIKEDSNNFNLFFEKEYFTKEENVFNYKVIVLDGVIQSIGEIHHILHDSAENKTSYVIFCYGTSDEVKHNIIINNKKNITKIYPICLNFNENTLNVLNDIAILHDVNIISANNGQTISTESKKLKSVGIKLRISKDSFSFIPVCSKFKLLSHKNFLNDRIKNAAIDSNKEVIINRYKNLFSKNLKIIIPEDIKKNSHLLREFDYMFKFFSCLNKNMTKIKSISHKKELYIPLHFLKIAKNKTNSIKNIFNNVEKLVLEEK